MSTATIATIATPTPARALDSQLAAAWALGLHTIPTARALVFIGDRENPSLRQIADHIGISGSAITGTADAFEKAGLARRIRTDSDRRHIRMELTPAGQAAVRKILAP
jgi:DNA-binding MarR family transcriptional regulator